MTTTVIFHLAHRSAFDYCTLMSLPWGSCSFFFFFLLYQNCAHRLYTQTTSSKLCKIGIGNVPLSNAIKWQLCCKACGKRLHSSHMDVSAVRRATTTCINFGFTPSALMATKATITGYGAEQNDGWTHYTMTENLPWAKQLSEQCVVPIKAGYFLGTTFCVAHNENTT